MAGLKRKQQAESGSMVADLKKSKKIKAGDADVKKTKKGLGDKSGGKKNKSSRKHDVEDQDEDDDWEVEQGGAVNGDEDEFGGFESDEEEGGVRLSADEEESPRDKKYEKKNLEKDFRNKKQEIAKDCGNLSSKESHAKQRALAKERKAAKPNADSIARAKKLWERLRMKSHVKLDERKKLVEELFDIITGNIKEFVLKHDSVRVIQCALKYANMEQRKMITKELKGEFRALAESRYAKFLIAKLLVEGDDEIKETVISDFYGHVRRLINHPEAAWILDDAYRGCANQKQKAILLREWYGPEFALLRTSSKEDKNKITGDLSDILEATPEKRKPILNDLYQLINQLIQKKMTGFTMLHDAMLQYYLNLKPESEEFTEFFESIKSDEEGDLLKNLAFTKSGSRIVCHTLAYSDAKGRRNLLKIYKDTMEMLAYDANGHHILLTAYDVIDDTKMTAKAIFPELFGPDANQSEQQEKIIGLATHLVGRVSLLYLLAGPVKWLVTEEHTALLSEIHGIRSKTSKKDAEVRRKELVGYLSEPVVAAIANRAADFASSSFGCYFVVEALLSATTDKSAALSAVANLALGDPGAPEHVAQSAPAGRMLKRLVEGGHFDASTKKVVLAEPALGFADTLYSTIGAHLVEWATGPSSFVVVGLLESSEFTKKEEALKTLKKNRKTLDKAANSDEGKGKAVAEEGKKSKKSKGEKPVRKGNAGARILLEKLG